MNVLLNNFTAFNDYLRDQILSFKTPSNHLLGLAQSYIDTVELQVMPKKLVGKNMSQNSWQTEFVDLKLLRDEKHAFTEWAANTADKASELFAVMVSDGWKTSVTWDTKNACFICSSTMRDEDDINYQVTVTSRSQEWFEGIMLNVYKLTVLHKGKDLRKAGGDDSWG